MLDLEQCIFPALRNPIEMMLTLLFRDQLVQCSLLNGKNGVTSIQLGKVKLLMSHASSALALNCIVTYLVLLASFFQLQKFALFVSLYSE